MENNIFENDYITLADEEGNDIEFKIIAQSELNDKTYFAVIPVEYDEKDDGILEYVILKLVNDGDGDYLVTIDDDDEFDEISDYFDDLFAQEIDYDN